MSIHNKISKNIRRKKFELVYTNERLITPGGLSIVGGLLEKSEFVRCSNRVPVEPKRSEPQIKNGDILLAYIGLLCQGKTAYEAVEEMRDDPDFYKDALGIKRGIPSAETLRQRMDDIGDSLRENILQGNACMFSSHNVEPGALPNGYVPVDIVERYGKPCSASPLMLAPDEELADGKRLYAMAGMQEESNMGTGSATMRAMLQAHIRSYSAIGIPNASAHVARMACLSCLALLQNFHTGNIGVIRRIGSETWRVAPLFDYDGSFGFRDDEHAVVSACAHPFVAAVMCANRFSFLDPSWDWTWYDPRVLDGFENHIVKALAPYKSMPSNFAELNANMFAMQRAYVNRVVSGGHDA